MYKVPEIILNLKDEKMKPNRKEMYRKLQEKGRSPEGRRDVEQMWADRFIEISSEGEIQPRPSTFQAMIQEILDHDYPDESSPDE